MDVVPVPNHREDQQQKRDQQQPGCFRRVDRVPVMLVRRIVRRLRGGHGNIVALGLGLGSEVLGTQIGTVAYDGSPMPKT